MNIDGADIIEYTNPIKKSESIYTFRKHTEEPFSMWFDTEYEAVLAYIANKNGADSNNIRLIVKHAMKLLEG